MAVEWSYQNAPLKHIQSSNNLFDANTRSAVDAQDVANDSESVLRRKVPTLEHANVKPIPISTASSSADDVPIHVPGSLSDRLTFQM